MISVAHNSFTYTELVVPAELHIFVKVFICFDACQIEIPYRYHCVLQINTSVITLNYSYL